MAGSSANYLRTLCTQHSEWVVDAIGEHDLPTGWRGLADQLFSALALVMVGRHEKIVIYRVARDRGALQINLRLTESTSPAWRPAIVDALVNVAREASLRTCCICGSLGTVRAIRGLLPLCDDHAAERLEEAANNLVPVRSEAQILGYLLPSKARPAQGTRSTTKPAPAPEPARDRLALYNLSDIAAALGADQASLPEGDNESRGEPILAGCSASSDNDQQARLRRLLEAGDAARWRRLASPTPSSLTALSDLGARAPHMARVTDFVRHNVQAALTIGLPVALPPLLLLGDPGLGKTWFLSRLAAALGLPFRRYPMAGQSLADGLFGSHPVWRHSKPGLVAKTLLSGSTANPLIFVDEVDKASSHRHEDPYRAFYDLLEQENATHFRDEYLEFAIDASRVIWVLAGNSMAALPDPILDRLTILAVPSPDETQSRAIAASVYAEANAARRLFFSPALDESVADRLAALSPRGMRKAIAAAMTAAAARGSARIRPDDIVENVPPRTRIGFH